MVRVAPSLTHSVESFCILLKEEMTVWQRHRRDHMQIIYNSPQTDNHATTSSRNVTVKYSNAQLTMSKL